MCLFGCTNMRAGPVMLVGVLPAAQKYPAGHAAATGHNNNHDDDDDD